MADMPKPLDKVDLSYEMDRAEAESRLLHAQRHLLHLRLLNAGLLDRTTLGPALLVLFEGWDASGKGGSIKRLVAPLDPRHVTVAAFAVPTERERRHHFLWRYFPFIPGQGGMTVFDRSWYGRVTVERVEELIDAKAWERAFEEINDFERSLIHEGVVLVKLFLHISDEEQLKRFDARRADPLKSWKLTDDDWRNRGRRPDYKVAINDMLDRTSTKHAPWDVLAANSKITARALVLETVVKRLEDGMRAQGIEPPISKGRDYAR
jgi:polyphosphate kinase 2 (PPK2 family)